MSFFYALIRKLLFQLDPETSHLVALKSLHYANRLGVLPRTTQAASPLSLMGITFPHRIGLAAGLDKNADYVDALAALGFAFIEVGTITPKPQEGNAKPRLFRLIKEEAIINRMGFNNKGVDYAASQLEKMQYRGILGINIGKNKETALENALTDYLICFRKLWKYASYITVNISSPNTEGLRTLQQGETLNTLLSALKKEQLSIYNTQQTYVPLVIKISPDLSEEAVIEIAEILLQQKIDGVIATNTTVSRVLIATSPYATESGGLSGKPLAKQSTLIIKQLYKVLQDKIPIIASGGIMDLKTAQEKLDAGACLLQLYTGFIYQGPALIQGLRMMDTR